MDEYSDVQFLERRRSPRYPCMGPAEILQSGRRLGWGTVKDISRGGCYIETAQPVPRGAEVQLRLTVAGTDLYVGAKVVANDPLVGMGLDFMVMPPEQGNKLAQIIEKITGPDLSLAVLQAERGEPNTVFRITQEAAPDILAKIIKRINEKGVLTRQELRDIVKSQQPPRLRVQDDVK
jgi:hypothetical protein